MAHARQQIRDAVRLTLSALTTVASASVFVSRPASRPLQASALPALRIYTLSEAVELVDSAGPQQRSMDLAIEAVVSNTGAIDNALDAICAEVESTLLHAVPAGVHLLELSNTDIEFNGEGEQPHGIARMTFNAIYYTREGAPEVMI